MQIYLVKALYLILSFAKILREGSRDYGRGGMDLGYGPVSDPARWKSE